MLSKCTDSKYAKFRTLLVDLLNYGAQSQIYTSYNTENLANAGCEVYNQYHKQHGAITNVSPEIEGIYMGTSLVLENSIEMQMGFTGIDGIEHVTVSYTNHTVLPEALECWNEDLFAFKLPRIHSIIKEINRRFCADAWDAFTGDWDKVSRMSILNRGSVRMANLSVIGSHTVNGVSKLHSDILTKTIFNDFYVDTPDKFTNVTNGIAHRRWLCYSNPSLASLLDECIGEGYRKNSLELENFKKFAESTDDYSIFFDYNWVTKALKQQGQLELPPTIELMKGSSIFFTINFEQGKVVGNAEVYANDELKKYQEKFYEKCN